MTNNNDSEKVRIVVSKEVYKRFVIEKVQDPPLLDSIARGTAPTELVCEVDGDVWADFTISYSDENITALREQMAMCVWSIHRDLDHTVLATMKDVVINILAEEIEHNEDEIRAIRRKQIDIETMSQLNEVIPEFIRYVGLDHDDLLKEALERALLYLHPGLLNS